MTTQTTSVLPELQPSLAVDDPAAMDRFNDLLIAEFRANRGKLSGQFTGAPIPVIALERGGN